MWLIRLILFLTMVTYLQSFIFSSPALVKTVHKHIFEIAEVGQEDAPEDEDEMVALVPR